MHNFQSTIGKNNSSKDPSGKKNITQQWPSLTVDYLNKVVVAALVHRQTSLTCLLTIQTLDLQIAIDLLYSTTHLHGCKMGLG